VYGHNILAKFDNQPSLTTSHIAPGTSGLWPEIETYVFPDPPKISDIVYE
jgi:hypothetical protein